jgi:hypothetical protein
MGEEHTGYLPGHLHPASVPRHLEVEALGWVVLLLQIRKRIDVVDDPQDEVAAGEIAGGGNPRCGPQNGGVTGVRVTVLPTVPG